MSFLLLILLSRPPYSASLQTLMDNMGYNIVMREEELNGPERFAADNILTEKQCKALMKLANVSVLLSLYRLSPCCRITNVFFKI